MTQITIGTKNQVVIPKAVRSKVKGFRPGSKVNIVSVDEATIVLKKVEEDWVEKTSGIAAEAWKGIDSTKFLQNLRDEWERKN